MSRVLLNVMTSHTNPIDRKKRAGIEEMSHINVAISTVEVALHPHQSHEFLGLECMEDWEPTVQSVITTTKSLFNNTKTTTVFK